MGDHSWSHCQTNSDQEMMRHRLLSISILILWEQLPVHGQDGIECYECEATYGSSKFRRGYCVNNFEEVEKVECLEGSCAKYTVARQRKKKEGLASLLDFADANEIEYVKRECARGEVTKEMKNNCNEKVEIERPADKKGTQLRSNGSFYDTQSCMCGQDLCNSGTKFKFRDIIVTI